MFPCRHLNLQWCIKVVEAAVAEGNQGDEEPFGVLGLLALGCGYKLWLETPMQLAGLGELCPLLCRRSHWSVVPGAVV